jgi:hypothetical protein
VRRDKPIRGFEIKAVPVGFDPGTFLSLLNDERQARLDLRGIFRGNHEILIARLRLYVNELLATGIGSNGEECSLNRDLTKAPNASKAIERVSDGRAMELKVAREGVSVRFFAEPPLSIREMGRTFESAQRAEETADRLFAMCCLSGWHQRLAQCRRPECGHYFELKHWNRVYKRGTVCPGCTRIRSLETAAASTSEARDQAQRELWGLAAKRFGKRITKDPDWYRNPAVRTGIVSFLNKQIEGSTSMRAVYPRGVTGKWLSWSKNRVSIEKIAKGKIHAKS